MTLAKGSHVLIEGTVGWANPQEVVVDVETANGPTSLSLDPEDVAEFCYPQPQPWSPGPRPMSFSDPEPRTPPRNLFDLVAVRTAQKSGEVIEEFYVIPNDDYLNVEFPAKRTLLVTSRYYLDLFSLQHIVNLRLVDAEILSADHRGIVYSGLRESDEGLVSCDITLTRLDYWNQTAPLKEEWGLLTSKTSVDIRDSEQHARELSAKHGYPLVKITTTIVDDNPRMLTHADQEYL